MGNPNSKYGVAVTKGNTSDCFRRPQVVLVMQTNGEWIAVGILTGKTCNPSVVVIPWTQTGKGCSSKHERLGTACHMCKSYFQSAPKLICIQIIFDKQSSQESGSPEYFKVY